MRALARAATVAAMAAGLATLAPAGHAEAPTVARVLPYMVTPCAAEDSAGCYWDAATMGDGSGHSFYALKVGRQTCIRYWSRAYDRTHGHCEKRG